MAENKTQPTDKSVDAFLESIVPPQRQADSRTVAEIMERLSQSPARMWGENIVGFGDTHYQYASGRQGDWFLVGFSPRKQNLTLYLTGGIGYFEEELKRLGKYKTSAYCLYINKLSGVDLAVLEEIIQKALRQAALK
ncbi:DUF1801 domain-containing protein [Runella sp. MFBS21]|uniref:DUF1801 domain-containing protein n=1 Tax=Runella sp. MFBS21 TaxID=3034018 RepID=UPI0023F63427|nr:DUF1801 domain-containing protein [Runella sp. MFBS21]MDF7820255.1 DUF1801 domain-containing protein [Runella sp. MFBS21]